MHYSGNTPIREEGETSDARRQRKRYSARKAQVGFEKKAMDLTWGEINGKRRTCARVNQWFWLRFYPKIRFRKCAVTCNRVFSLVEVATFCGLFLRIA